MQTQNPVLELRLMLDVTQEELGRAVGWSQGDVSKLEAGKRRLSGETALRWWREYRPELVQLGYTLEDLLKIGIR